MSSAEHHISWNMAIEVVVGPSLVTINRRDTFVLSETDGCITAYTDQRFYSRDTRYVSNYEIFADGERWILQKFRRERLLCLS
jgi:N-terminal domain of (some) glycogen debranching enzymes